MPRSARAWLAVVLSALVAPRAISAQSPAAADSALLGLWGVEASLGPQVSGPLELERTAAGWRMHVAGFAATTPDTASTIPLPGGQGMLRLAQSNGGTLRAFWVQPPGNVPMPMATPVQLARVRPGVWRGTVRPLDDRVITYLLVTRDASDSLRAVFRNPVFNWPGPAVPWRYILDVPLVHDPGTTYAYCSGGMNLAGGALRQAAGLSVLELFDRDAARPLGITRYAAALMPNGDMYAGGGVWTRPRDLLKLGAAYLDGGRWHGARVATPAWIAASTGHVADAPDGSSDGLGWHRHVLRAGGRDVREYDAAGNGGQFLIVLPDLDMAVVITAGNQGQTDVANRFRDQLVPEYIIAAVKH